jgi:predicted nucleotide-binding protein
LEAKIVAVEGYIEELEIDVAIRQLSVSPGTRTVNVDPELSKKIFIVHGHDEKLKEATARLIAQLKLESVILHEQSKRGRTIIENLLIHAKESGFAIVLLSADDVGSAGTVGAASSFATSGETKRRF